MRYTNREKVENTMVTRRADDKGLLTDEVKASVMNSGALATLKQVSFDGKTHSSNNELAALKDEAESVIENIQQMLDGGNLDSGTSQKLTAALSKLKAALSKGSISREVLATALSDAVAAIGGVDGAGKEMSPQQKADQLWKRVEANNKEIDDDFTKMQKAGIVLNQSLLGRHNELMEYLKTHPRDIATQKELDAVDDAMLLQVEPQIGQKPGVKEVFDDAKKKSDDRHQMVDKDLSGSTKDKNLLEANKDSDWEKSSALSMNDVKLQPVGQKQRPGEKHLS